MTPVGPASLRAVRASIAGYYAARARKHGATPMGVDWYTADGQQLRFAQLLKVVDFAEPVSIHDLGCGYGALLTYLEDRRREADIDYWGSDVCAEMIRLAARESGAKRHAHFVVAPADIPEVDYTLASGIFNVNVSQSLEAWEHYVCTTFAEMAANSRKGFAANLLAPVAGPSSVSVRPLYRVAPRHWLKHCERTLTCEVDVVEGYGLGEYTLLAWHRSGSASRGRQA